MQVLFDLVGDEMKKTVTLNKVNLLGVFFRTALPLVITGVIIGLLMGGYLYVKAGAAGVNHLSTILKVGLLVGLQGLALSILITLLAGIYNIVIGLIGGIMSTGGDTDNQ